ncbi:conserved hypothetical protein [Desulforamulus reducens MI-1]|uniref:Uncharacterized protein n=1 Tax=Desulforamulus reducens (strain ATCC BAA-1160 / DSM 100696 / MI-1) TaxID=349161 RepID=A4J4P9_DESRM|nr:hypothetical protein [Desulforamulus reducens]ABO50052.1 conserved hypothetical protein [Desulforamulus reducens MI-1]
MESGKMANKKLQLIALKKDMYENTAHSAYDFDKVTEINQHLSGVIDETLSYKNTQKQAEKVYSRLKNRVEVQLLRSCEGKMAKGAIIIPAYMAKGLEFDVVMVYNANEQNYSSKFDKKLRENLSK